MTHKIKVNNVEIELTPELIREIKALPDEPEFEYPVIMKDVEDGEIARFDSKYERTTLWTGAIWIKAGHITKRSAFPATHKAWQPVPYNKERWLWHGQPVEHWNDHCTHARERGFYNAKNDSVFDFLGGELEETTHDNIVAIPPEEYKDWMFEAYKTLEGI